MSLPIVNLSGSPYEQGVQHGEALRDRILHNLAVYFDRFQHDGRVPRAEVLARSQKYLAAIEAQNAGYVEGVRGVADGSGAELLELAALNLRYEILYYQHSVNAMADGCTAFAVLPSSTVSGHLLMGQNWDWIPGVQGAVLHTVEADGLETVSFTEAGIVGGKIGVNSAGLGLAVNGLNTTDDDWSRLSKPFHVRCYEILRARDFDAAVGVVAGEDRACSTNFLIAQAPDRVTDVEAAPGSLRLLECDDGCLVHTNHFLEPDALGIVEPPKKKLNTYDRLRRMRELLDGRQPIGLSDIQASLSDHQGHPDSICRHPDPQEPAHERYMTVTSVIVDLHARRVWISDGPPCENEFQEIGVSAC